MQTVCADPVPSRRVRKRILKSFSIVETCHFGFHSSSSRARGVVDLDFTPPKKQQVPVGTERGYVTRDAEPSPQVPGLSFVLAPPVLFHTLLLAKNCIQCVFSLRSSSRRLVASHLVVAVKIGYIQQVARSFFLK